MVPAIKEGFKIMGDQVIEISSEHNILKDKFRECDAKS